MTARWRRLGYLLKAMRHAEGWRLQPRIARAMLRSLAAFRPVSAGSGTILYVNSPPVEGRAFGRYLGGLNRVARGERVPLVVHVAVTDRCPLRCARCSSRAMRTAEAPDPGAGLLLALLSDLKRAGTVSVAFTGGEPVLRHDLAKLVAACVPEMSPLLFTSGQGVTAALARELRAAGLAMAAVSLDDHRERVHDAIRGVPGAFRGACQAIGHFRDAGVYTAAQAVVDGALLADRRDMEAFLRFCGELGVHDVVLLDPAAAVRSEADTAYLTGLHRRSASGRLDPKVTAAAFLEGRDGFGCLAGYSFFHVTAAGELCPCDFVPLSLGNVFGGGLDEALRRAAGAIATPCTRCLAVQATAGPGCGRLPAAWEETRAVLAGFDGGQPAALMQALAAPRRPA